MTQDHDFDFEPLPGLPAALPEGERLIWRGTPDPWRLAARACRLPLIGGYFAVLAGWQLATAVHEGGSLAQIGNALSFTATLAAASLGLLALLGWVIAKNTFYTVTSRRVIVRHGVAMPMAINIPFAKIEGAGTRAWADGTVDISFKLSPNARVPHLLLWPHARPGRYWPTEPMLRAVPDGARVARLVAEALAAANAADLVAAEPTPAEPRVLGKPIRNPAPAIVSTHGAMPGHTVPAS